MKDGNFAPFSRLSGSHADRKIPRVGRAQAARRPVDEPDAERRLKLLEPIAHCRLRDIQVAAGGGEPPHSTMRTK
jgi:hypothetical protein